MKPQKPAATLELDKSFVELLERARTGARAIPNSLYADAVNQVIEIAERSLRDIVRRQEAK